MRLSLFLLFAVVLITSCNKKVDPGPTLPPPIIFTHDGTITGNDNAVVMDADSNLIICGMSGDDIVLLKTTQFGEELWRKQFNAGIGCTANALIQTSGNFFICGSTKRNAANGDDILIVKLTLEGDTVWTRTFGYTGTDIGHCMVESGDSNIIVVAECDNYFQSSDPDVYLMKMSPNGANMWHASYPYSGDEIPAAVIKSRIDGSYFIYSNKTTNTFDGSLQVLSTSKSGVPLWNLPISDNSNTGFVRIKSAMEYDNGNSVMLIGSEQIGTDIQALILEVSSTGSINSSHRFGSSNTNESASAMKINYNSGYVLTGSREKGGNYDAVIINGIEQKVNGLNLPEGGEGIAIYKDKKDHNIVIGNTGTGKIFVVKSPILDLWN